MGDTGLGGYDAAALLAAGVVIASEGLPYPPMPTPPYRPAQGRDWRFSQVFLPAAPGYFSGPRQLSWMNAILSRGGTTWMSLVPMEVESQLPHLAAARGTVVVCGLGLGVMAYAVAARRAVDRVVVVERDPEVLAMFRQFTDFDAWPQRAKVEIVQADAREFRMDGVDFLYVDIWPFYRMDAMIADMKAIYRGVPAPACGYWGQELDMVDAAMAGGTALGDFDASHVRAFATAHGLPLIGQDEPTYPELCRRAATNPAIRSQRVPAGA